MTGSTSGTTAAITALSIALLSSRCFAGAALDGAGMFAFPAEHPGSAPLLALPIAAPHTGRIEPKIVVRFVSQTIERVRKVGVAPLFFGFHGLGVAVSGEM